MKIKVTRHVDLYKVDYEKYYTEFLYKQSLQDGRQACPHASEHSTKSSDKDFTLSLSSKTTPTGFRSIQCSCWHGKCEQSLKKLYRKLNDEFFKFVIDEGQKDPNTVCVEDEKLAIKRFEESKKLAYEKLDASLKADQEFKRFSKWMDNIGNQEVPEPLCSDTIDETFIHLTMFNLGEIIFLGQPMESAGSLYRLNWDNVESAFKDKPINFISTSTFKDDNGSRTKDNVMRSRYIVLEMDGEPNKQIQFNKLVALSNNLSPMLACIDSGGKSLHGWFERSKVEPYKKTLGKLGYDEKTMMTQQPVRIAGMYRSEKNNFQRLIYFNKEEVKKVKTINIESNIQ